jgi:hypothetical protein
VRRGITVRRRAVFVMPVGVVMGYTGSPERCEAIVSNVSRGIMNERGQPFSAASIMRACLETQKLEQFEARTVTHRYVIEAPAQLSREEEPCHFYVGHISHCRHRAMAMGAPVDEITEEFERRHRKQCKRCQEYATRVTE